MPPKATLEYVAVRHFRQSDPRTGKVTVFEPGDLYAGSLEFPYLLDPSGPDGQGPLIAEKSVPAPAAASGESHEEK